MSKQGQDAPMRSQPMKVFTMTTPKRKQPKAFKTLLRWTGLALLAGIAYLLLAPVPVSPQSWNAPQSQGYTGAFVPNMKLSGLKTLSIGGRHGPESVTARQEADGLMIYAATQDGDILRINPRENTHSVFANTGGVPLGLQFDSQKNLIVADAHKGLLHIEASGNTGGAITVLTNTAEAGSPILYADELDIAQDGKIYFSDASTKFGAQAAGSTLAASLLEILEHGKTGRILVYDPADKSTRTLARGLSFPNGIALCPNETCLLFAETGTYSVKRLWLSGTRAGQIETVIDNLPGFPDNLDRGLDGRYWLGLTSPRVPILDKLSDKPFLRKIVQRLPARLRPAPTHYGFVMAINENGQVLAQYQDPSGAYPLTTGALEASDGWLYIGSLGATALGRKDLRRETFGN